MYLNDKIDYKNENDFDPDFESIVMSKNIEIFDWAIKTYNSVHEFSEDKKVPLSISAREKMYETGVMHFVNYCNVHYPHHVNKNVDKDVFMALLKGGNKEAMIRTMGSYKIHKVSKLFNSNGCLESIGASCSKQLTFFTWAVYTFNLPIDVGTFTGAVAHGAVDICTHLLDNYTIDWTNNSNFTKEEIIHRMRTVAYENGNRDILTLFDDTFDFVRLNGQNVVDLFLSNNMSGAMYALKLYRCPTIFDLGTRYKVMSVKMQALWLKNMADMELYEEWDMLNAEDIYTCNRHLVPYRHLCDLSEEEFGEEALAKENQDKQEWKAKVKAEMEHPDYVSEML